ncbi:outer membrane beta-barrel protein [Spirosoma linguale]|uniref:Outer membrane protein beta-barrel domain-containing protein n=1 Tax=Spirosoma linguale (strain ATCC 33905 / DSM 74 / LMG 10896 / Claus 1) TaxID=504472 RepID=D2QP87_SPILD|nr:hypothetical protein Slin_3387 [Spirosoma linguale DSM 74]
MKTLFFFLASSTFVLAQSRVSVAPTYWFNHGNYAYQVYSAYDGSETKSSGYSLESSAGLTARYKFNRKWDFSIGVLYSRGTSYVKTPQSNDIKLTTEYIQLPVLINYRLSERRLAPYFSAGAIFGKNKSVSNDPVKTSAIVGIGLDYKISSKLSWLIQPTASYLFYKPDNTILYQFRDYNSYNIGVQTQLILHF